MAGAYSVKRAPGLHFRIERRKSVDLDLLQRGEPAAIETEQWVAYVGATGREYLLDLSDLQVLAAAGSVDWQVAGSLAARCGVDAPTIDAMVDYGLLISDREVAAPASSLDLWDEDALYFHQRSRWEGFDADLPETVESAAQRQDASERFFAGREIEHGPAPTHFHSRSSPEPSLELPVDDYATPLAALLARRQTTRQFAKDEPLDWNSLSTALRAVFGAQGTSALAERVTGLRKTSPSGGAMHPIEAYPMVLNVDKVAPGIYHYHVGRHHLEPVRGFSEAEGRELARLFTAGQAYYTTAQVLILYTARYERNFWKYRRNPRAYKVVHMDLGHLSQTLYLVCADLGLGAFFTAACNEVDIEKALAIDGIGEAAIAIGGLGIPSTAPSSLNLSVAPYEPPRDQR